MRALFHSIAALSIAGMAGSALNAAAPSSPYFGRWTVNEAKPVFTAKGRMYKTIDIAPCGKDFCGVSVGDGGTCGPVLFRFLMKHANADMTLHGHAKWGTQTKNVQINTWELDAADWPGGREIDLYVGDGYDFGDRSDNMPKFHGEYKRIGVARCLAR
ncbi:MAG: hypothetical protein ACKOPM_00290 [Novosphingobium sp.]